MLIVLKEIGALGLIQRNDEFQNSLISLRDSTIPIYNL